jgi:hypothetical protein
MRNFILTAFVVFGFSLTSLAQKNTVTSGGEATGSGGTVSYSIGQIDYKDQSGNNGDVNQGLQQPYEIFIVGIDANPEISLEMVLYPNPTDADINLKVGKKFVGKFTYQLFDLNGKRLVNEKISGVITSIPTSILRSATYFLNVSDDSQVVKTFKIIKYN